MPENIAVVVDASRKIHSYFPLQRTAIDLDMIEDKKNLKICNDIKCQRDYNKKGRQLTLQQIFSKKNNV